MCWCVVEKQRLISSLVPSRWAEVDLQLVGCVLSCKPSASATEEAALPLS